GERGGGELDRRVGAPLRVPDRALAADDEGAAPDLEVHGLELDPGQLDLDDGLLRSRLPAVVDVDARHERGRLAALAVAGLVPEVAQQLIHLPTHAGEVG